MLTRLALSAVASVLFLACVHHSGLSHQVAESVHRDYPSCSGHEMTGAPIDEAAGTWSVDACGVQVTYQCPTGPNSRWHHCTRVGDPPADTTGGAVVSEPPASQ